MTRDGKIIVALCLLAVGGLSAIAANDTVGVSVGAGKIANLIKFGSNNVISEVGICDATTENQCAAVNASGQLAVNVAASSVNQAVTVASGAVVDGGITTLGAQADAAAASDTSTATLIALLKRNNQNLTTLNTTAGGAATLAAAATGGCTGATLLTAANNNATVIGSAAAHTLCWLRWENTTTSLVDIRLYDTATTPSGGAPCNSATGVVSNDVVQSNAVSPGGVANLGPFGMAFASGIVMCVTGANANNDNTNAVTGINISYGFK